MGQAKRRGTYEERKAEGEIKEAERRAEVMKRAETMRAKSGGRMPLIAALVGMAASTMMESGR